MFRTLESSKAKEKYLLEYHLYTEMCYRLRWVLNADMHAILLHWCYLWDLLNIVLVYIPNIHYKSTWSHEKIIIVVLLLNIMDLEFMDIDGLAKLHLSWTFFIKMHILSQLWPCSIATWGHVSRAYNLHPTSWNKAVFPIPTEHCPDSGVPIVISSIFQILWCVQPTAVDNAFIPHLLLPNQLEFLRRWATIDSLTGGVPERLLHPLAVWRHPTRRLHLPAGWGGSCARGILPRPDRLDRRHLRGGSYIL
jgi:hypothetical protein